MSTKVKTRRHHNNTGLRQIKRDAPYREMRYFAKRFFREVRRARRLAAEQLQCEGRPG